MTDSVDPQEILKAAGEQCPELDEWDKLDIWCDETNPFWVWEQGDVPLAALARLVAKWKDAADMRSQDAIVFEEERDRYKAECAILMLENQHLADLASERNQTAAMYKRLWEELTDLY